MIRLFIFVDIVLSLGIIFVSVFPSTSCPTARLTDVDCNYTGIRSLEKYLVDEEDCIKYPSYSTYFDILGAVYAVCNIIVTIFVTVRFMHGHFRRINQGSIKSLPAASPPMVMDHEYHQAYTPPVHSLRPTLFLLRYVPSSLFLAALAITLVHHATKVHIHLAKVTASHGCSPYRLPSSWWGMAVLVIIRTGLFLVETIVYVLLPDRYLRENEPAVNLPDFNQIMQKTKKAGS